MPDIKRIIIDAAHLAGHTIRLISIIRPSFLITEDLTILVITLRKDFLIKHSLLTDISKDRPIKIKARFTRPMTLNALLVSMIITSNHNANDITMLSKGLHKVMVGIRSLRHTNNSTLRSIRTGTSAGLLNDLININRDTVATEIFRSLQAGIRGSHTKMRLENLDITSTTTGIALIKLLNLESHTELVDRGNNSITRIDSPKIRWRNSLTTSKRRIITSRKTTRSVCTKSYTFSNGRPTNNRRTTRTLNRTHNRIRSIRIRNFKRRKRHFIFQSNNR